jgi:hypothetical protein
MSASSFDTAADDICPLICWSPEIHAAWRTGGVVRNEVPQRGASWQPPSTEVKAAIPVGGAGKRSLGQPTAVILGQAFEPAEASDECGLGGRGNQVV